MLNLNHRHLGPQCHLRAGVHRDCMSVTTNGDMVSSVDSPSGVLHVPVRKEEPQSKHFETYMHAIGIDFAAQILGPIKE